MRPLLILAMLAACQADGSEKTSEPYQGDYFQRSATPATDNFFCCAEVDAAASTVRGNGCKMADKNKGCEGMVAISCTTTSILQAGALRCLPASSPLFEAE